MTQLRKRIFITIIIFLPTILFGQSKDCHSVLLPPKTISCFLTLRNKINDTTISTLPIGCNDFHFDSIPNGYCKIITADNTTLKEIVAIKNGKRNGKSISFYDNGKIKQKVEYKNDGLNGNYISYFETGKIYKQGHIKKNKKEYEFFTGTETEYWDNGNIANQEVLKNGITKHIKYYDKDGKGIDARTFRQLWYECE